MVTVALSVRLEAKPGKEAEVATFLRGGLSIVEEEPGTAPDEPSRHARLTGRIAAALMARASDLFAQPPVIEKAEVLAAKLPR